MCRRGKCSPSCFINKLNWNRAVTILLGTYTLLFHQHQTVIRLEQHSPETAHTLRNYASCPRLYTSFSPFVVPVGWGWGWYGFRGHRKRVPMGQESPLSNAGCCCQREGVSIIYPRQINKPVERPWYVCRVKEFVIKQTLSRCGWWAFQKERSYSRPTWKTSWTPLHHKLRLHPQTYLSTILRWLAFTVQVKTVCYNAVIFCILVLYCIIRQSVFYKLRGTWLKNWSFHVLSPKRQKQCLQGRRGEQEMEAKNKADSEKKRKKPLYSPNTTLLTGDLQGS